MQYSICGQIDISVCYRTVQLLALTVLCLLPSASLSNLEQNETIFVNVTTNSTTLQYAFHTGFAVVTLVCCSFSMTGSTFLLVTYSLFKDLHTLPSLLLMSLSSAFLVGDLSLLLGSSVLMFQLKAPCIVAAIFLHYFLLARFCWTNMISFEMMRTFTAAIKLIPVLSSRSKRTLFAIYSRIGWGIPLLIILISVTINFTSDGLVGYGYGLDICWITDNRLHLVFFAIPLALSLLFNLLSFIWVIVSLCDSSTRNRTSMQDKLNIRLYVAVFSVMGFMWIFILTAIVANGSSWTRYSFVALNSTQVLVVSLSFTCSKKVGRHYRELFHSSRSVAQSSGVPGNQPTASSKVSPAT